MPKYVDVHFLFRDIDFGLILALCKHKPLLANTSHPRFFFQFWFQMFYFIFKVFLVQNLQDHMAIPVLLASIQQNPSPVYLFSIDQALLLTVIFVSAGVRRKTVTNQENYAKQHPLHHQLLQVFSLQVFREDRHLNKNSIM